MTCRLELDIGPGTTENAVEFNSTMGQLGLIILEHFTKALLSCEVL